MKRIWTLVNSNILVSFGVSIAFFSTIGGMYVVFQINMLPSEMSFFVDSTTFSSIILEFSIAFVTSIVASRIVGYAFIHMYHLSKMLVNRNKSKFIRRIFYRLYRIKKKIGRGIFYVGIIGAFPYVLLGGFHGFVFILVFILLLIFSAFVAITLSFPRLLFGLLKGAPVKILLRSHFYPASDNRKYISMLTFAIILLTFSSTLLAKIKVISSSYKFVNIKTADDQILIGAPIFQTENGIIFSYNFGASLFEEKIKEVIFIPYSSIISISNYQSVN